ncbi:hypothetical protein BDW59DRAFT_118582 [Aspergillus cavernicola]|uniref:Uncharacterized protein n=1 Tax=Aspergillus cavernicola TaxID=176166 RepID=A0ABR4HXM1_9EURO
MPPLDISLLPVHIPRSIATSNATDLGLQVVCAWPVSGQYGPGTRILYYVLIAACIFAQKEEWLRNACLAGALLFPAIAALHGIVLASIHVDGAIDMDIYGAFQLCSIGILTAPLTVRLSNTYLTDPRRNIIFLWTGLLLAGLVSITVEFFRVKPSTCTHDDFQNPISSDVSMFPYSNITSTTCHIPCSVDRGPFSPIRVGPNDEIYVIPSPNKLTFGTAALFAAGCCVLAIVSLIYLSALILQEPWKTDTHDQPIEGTNGATVGNMLQINQLVRKLLRAVEVPVFAAAVLAILIVGERNFWSTPVDYGTEPIASIGQWAPIVGAGFAILGSLYLFLTGDDASPSRSASKCTCHQLSEPSMFGAVDEPETSTTTSPPPAPVRPTRHPTTDVGSRRKINARLMRFGNYLSIAAHDRLHDSGFKQGRALDFPELPGEELRSGTIHRIREVYNHPRDSNGNITLSRAGSTVGVDSQRDADGSSTASQTISPRSSRQSTRSRSPSPCSALVSRRPDDDRTALEMQNIPISSPVDPPIRQTRRRQTLEVPPHHGPIRRSLSISSVSSSSFTIPGSQASPVIIVSADGDGPPMSPLVDMHPVAATASPQRPRSESELPLRHERRFTS